MAAIGVALIALAVPRLASGILLAPYDDTLARLGRGETVAGAELARAVDSRRAALAWLETGRVRADLGALYLAWAAAPGLREAARMAMLDRAIAAFRAGLGLAPAQPFAWTMLGQATLRRLGPGAGGAVAPVLRMALITAPYEPRLVAPRLAIGLAVLRSLSPELRDLLVGQVTFALDRRPSLVVDLVRRRYVLTEMRALLADRPAVRRRFETAYLRSAG
jgi:hypothetical protein